MKLTEFFSTTPTIDADEVREMAKKLDYPDFQLVDVRHLSEYAEKHISGAKLIPLGDLKEHLDELDKNKPTILY